MLTDLDTLADLAARLIGAIRSAEAQGVSVADALDGADLCDLGIDAAAAFWIGEGARGTDIPPDPDYLDHYNLGRELARRFARPLEGRA